MTISATPAELINNQNQQSAVSLDILERVTRSQPEPAPQGILGPPSEKVHTILITLRMTDEIADSIRRNVMRSPPDHAMVRRLISESCERATSRLRSLLKYPGAPDEIQSLPYLHQAVLRTPKRSFVEWAATGAAKEVVSSYCAIRDQHVAVPTQGELHAAGFFSRWRLTRVAQWGDFLASTGFAAMHSMGVRGTGQLVGVLDSGVDVNHPYLSQQKIQSFARFNRLSQLMSNYPIRDEHRHGTQVAGLLVGEGTNGPVGGAPGAKLVVASVLNAPSTRRRLPWGRLVQIHAGLNWLLQLREVNQLPLSVVNLSVSVHSAQTPQLVALQSALQIASVSGIQPVVAVGNDPRRESRIAGDGFSVGALREDGIRVWEYSGPNPKIVAPGHRVLCCKPVNHHPVGENIEDSGTSFACPLVSAGLLLLMEATQKDVEVCRESLIQAARIRMASMRRRGRPEQWGQGPLNVHGAFELLTTRSG